MVSSLHPVSPPRLRLGFAYPASGFGTFVAHRRSPDFADDSRYISLPATKRTKRKERTLVYLAGNRTPNLFRRLRRWNHQKNHGGRRGLAVLSNAVHAPGWTRYEKEAAEKETPPHAMRTRSTDGKFDENSMRSTKWKETQPPD